MYSRSFQCKISHVWISAAENFPEEAKNELKNIKDLADKSKSPILGITGTGGAGKSSLVDELVRRFLTDFPDKRLAIVSVDLPNVKQVELY